MVSLAISEWVRERSDSGLMRTQSLLLSDLGHDLMGPRPMSDRCVVALQARSAGDGFVN